MKWPQASLLALSAATVVHSRPTPDSLLGEITSAAASELDPITDSSQLNSIVDDLFSFVDNGTITYASEAQTAVMNIFKAIKPTTTLTSVPQALQIIASQFGLTAGQPAPSEVPAQSILKNALGLVLNGFTSSDIEAVLNGAVGNPIFL